VKKRGGAANAYAVCTAAGTRNPDLERKKDILRSRIRAAEEAMKWARAHGRSQAAASREAHKAVQELKRLESQSNGKRKRNPRNPEEGSIRMSERFHGRKVIEVKEIDETVHFHRWLAELGELERLKVRACDGGIVTLEDFDGCLLCSNE